MAKIVVTLDRHHSTARVNPDLVGVTELELASLLAIALEGMESMGGDEPLKLHGDNMSWFTRADIVKRVACSDMQARALMGSLQRKGLVMDYDSTERGKGKAHWILTDMGINAAQHAWAEVYQLDEKLRAHPSINQVLNLQGY